MIRTAATPLARTLACTTRSSCLRASHPAFVALGSRRALASTSGSQVSLKSKRVDETASKGAEGLHYMDTAVFKKQPVLHHSDVPVTGDWVLFHPVYTTEELKAVQPSVHYTSEKISDKCAAGLVKVTRKLFDLVSGFHHKEIPAGSTMSIEELRKKGYVLTETGWMNRCLFLETIAGIPGMVAATIRHLHSLRLMRRDAGWIHTLLEEAENERMHLMSFLAIRKPGVLMRALILGAQGVYYNAFFFSYLISPRICHRFVGYLEEEAVRTYSLLIADIKSGRFPEWADQPAPAIAKDYWRLKSDATYLDMIYAIRSDETTHRFVNHTLANLQKDDVNPFAIQEPDMTVKGVKYGFEREESAQYMQESQKLLISQNEKRTA